MLHTERGRRGGALHVPAAMAQREPQTSAAAVRPPGPRGQGAPRPLARSPREDLPPPRPGRTVGATGPLAGRRPAQAPPHRP
eukprot:6755884-Lingulodinium_polyedra.AAC.2